MIAPSMRQFFFFLSFMKGAYQTPPPGKAANTVKDMGNKSVNRKLYIILRGAGVSCMRYAPGMICMEKAGPRRTGKGKAYRYIFRVFVFTPAKQDPNHNPGMRLQAGCWLPHIAE